MHNHVVNLLSLSNFLGKKSSVYPYEWLDLSLDVVFPSRTLCVDAVIYIAPSILLAVLHLNKYKLLTVCCTSCWAMLSHQLVFCWKNAGVAAAGWWWWGGCISLRELTSVHSWEVAGIERAADSFTRAHSGYETSPGQNSMLQYLLCEWANAAGDCSLFPPPCLDWRELPHLSSASSGIWTDCQQQSRFWYYFPTREFYFPNIQLRSLLQWQSLFLVVASMINSEAC